jgi:hypothetical protein
LRIDSRVRPQASFDTQPTRDLASEQRAAEVQAQAAQALQQNPALQAFRGESGFEGAGGVQGLKQTPALQAFQGVSGFDGAGAAQAPGLGNAFKGMRGFDGAAATQPPNEQEAQAIPSARMPWPFIDTPEWFKVLWGIKN